MQTNTLTKEQRLVISFATLSASRIQEKLSLIGISTNQLTFCFYAVRPRSLVFTYLLVCLSD
ncbi:hypothetical protein HOR11_gp088 [Lactobacillus phage SA-C12]|uniref:Uncharacterized protein n=1 Tax=Lactobacillus phage SA-C12 TaxID=1755697 RepID=A0A1I9KKH9_9CAUD|nr:hypothetical protein HOR11_gp088 [Lactobacillus phage SA-C12]ALY06909.1 hypothetical protein SAC12_088 [Lactobacillus phage SA-C12]